MVVLLTTNTISQLKKVMIQQSLLLVCVVTTSQGSESQPGQLRTTLEVTDNDGLTGNKYSSKTITLVDNGQPSHGDVVLGNIERNSNNPHTASVSFTYTPTKADFYGSDIFTIEITDDKNEKQGKM